MYIVDSCPCCNSSNIIIEDSKLAKFVFWRVTGNYVENDQKIKSLKCNSCDFYGTLERFTDSEEFSLYDGYRETRYNEMRIICEPLYKEICDNFDQEQYIKNRSIGINKLIQDNIDYTKIETVLDFGGGTGIHIPKIFYKSKKIVYDISGVDTIYGIEKLDKALVHENIDFLMCCHVLEHKSNLDNIIEDIKKLITKNTFVYFEVPNTTFDLSFESISRFHEHINLFKLSSLSALLKRHKFKIVDVYINEFLCVLARLE